MTADDRSLVVLCVDDDADQLELLGYAMETRGARVVLASSVVEAREILDSLRVDAIVSDTVMPDHDGFDLLAQLNARGAHPPVIFVSAAGWRAPELARAGALGAAATLTRPHSIEALLEAVSRSILAAQKTRVDPVAAHA